MSAEWMICLIISLSLLGLWAICYRVQGSWVSPGGMLCGFWFFASLLPLFFTSFFPIPMIAYWILLAFVVCGVLGSSLAMLAGVPKTPKPLTDLSGRIRLWERAYVASLAVGSAAPLWLYYLTTHQFGTTDVMQLARQITVARYTGDFDQPLSVSLLVMWLYFAAMLGGLLIGLQRPKGKQLGKYMLWLLPMLLTTLIETTKASSLYGGLLWGAAYLGGIALRDGGKSVQLGRLLWTVTGFAVLGFVFVYLGLLMRYGATDMDRALQSLPSAAVYFVGHMSGLGNWAQQGAMLPEVSNGSYTFAGIFELLHMHTRAEGLYDNYIVYPNGLATNIFTAFRSAIEDFTLPGALVFFTLLSFLGGLGWVGLRRGQPGVGVLCIIFLAYVFSSPITSPFVYNTNTGALILFSLLMLIRTSTPARLPVRKEVRLELA